jgi:hypothetical protein
MNRERHLAFEVGRRADWCRVKNSAADFAAGLEGWVQMWCGAAGSCHGLPDSGVNRHGQIGQGSRSLTGGAR